MTTLTETTHPGAFLVSEAAGFRSRDAVTIKSGEGVIVPGQILGKARGVADTVTVGTPTLVGTGQGLFNKATPAYGAGVKAGNYRVVCIEPASNLGTFIVIDPDGVEIGTANVGVAFDGVLKFTIADNSADFVAGDTWTVPVTISTDAMEYRSCDPTNTDGSEVAAAIALYGCDATSAAQEITAVTRDAEVNVDWLTYDAAIDTAAKKATAWAQLATAHIIVR